MPRTPDVYAPAPRRKPVTRTTAKAGLVRIRRADGSTTTRPPYSPSAAAAVVAGRSP